MTYCIIPSLLRSGFRMRLPVLSSNLALVGTGLLGLGADIVDFIPHGHVSCDGLTVEQHKRNILGLAFVNNDRNG